MNINASNLLSGERRVSGLNSRHRLRWVLFTSIWWITVDMLVISIVERFFRLRLKYLIPLKEMYINYYTNYMQSLLWHLHVWTRFYAKLFFLLFFLLELSVYRIIYIYRILRKNSLEDLDLASNDWLWVVYLESSVTNLRNDLWTYFSLTITNYSKERSFPKLKMEEWTKEHHSTKQAEQPDSKE